MEIRIILEVRRLKGGSSQNAMRFRGLVKEYRYAAATATAAFPLKSVSRIQLRLEFQPSLSSKGTQLKTMSDSYFPLNAKGLILTFP
ncbi:hypothetical protein SDJN03_00696, partial [Cucurbita argyrosperma subsp. sororia]